MVPAKRHRNSSRVVQSRGSRTSKRQAKDQNEEIQPMTRREERLSELKKLGEELELRGLIEEEHARQQALAEKLAKVKRAAIQQEQASFLFLRLPPELRNMVYRYLVVSPAALQATDGQCKRSASLPKDSGLSLGILRVSKQVSAEAIALLYRENLVMVSQHCYHAHCFRPPVLRHDVEVPRLHNLRKGYIGKVRHVGAIYPHVFARLRRLAFKLDISFMGRNNEIGDFLSHWKGIMKTYVDLLLSEPNAGGISLQIEATLSRKKVQLEWFLQQYGFPIEALEVQSDLEAYFKQLQTSMLNQAAPYASRLNYPSTRRGIQDRRFTPFAPPDPQALPKAAPPKTYRRTRKWLRRLFWLSVAVGVASFLDRQLYHSSLTRSARTFGFGLVVGTDYKINFRAHPPFADSIEALHARNAEKLFNLLRTNGGLYLKIGQAIAMQSAVLPPEFQKMFARMFDDAPQNSWADVERVIREDFGKSVEEVFGISFEGESGKGVMERTARASASVAQVHFARLADGREVAVKIQKREIAQQVGWDLWAFKVVARVYTWWFDIPMYSLVPYISSRLLLETDFLNEADNSERMKKLVAGESRLRDRVYIPRVYRELSSRRILTAEWIEGVRLWDKEGIQSPWKGGWRTGSPGCKGTPLDPPTGKEVASLVHNDPTSERLKPERNHWRGPDGKGGLGLSMKAVMTTMVDLFSAQMFLFGVIHCDPHPGNIFIRRQPNGKPELVLIDHGLYITLNPKFRHDYALFWKSLMTFDNKTIARIVKGWGINSPDIFASATLMRPYGAETSGFIKRGLSGKDEAERAFEMQQKMRQGIKQILGDEKKLPRELIFLGRNLRIVQGNNQFLGSPVNRIKITGNWASRALVESPDLSYTEKFKNLGRHVLFKFVIFGSDVVFYYSKVRQMLGLGGGMEDDIEERMRHMARDFGIELNHSVFEG